VNGRKVVGYVLVGLGLILIIFGIYIGVGVFMDIYYGRMSAHNLVLFPFLFFVIPGIVLIIIGVISIKAK